MVSHEVKRFTLNKFNHEISDDDSHHKDAEIYHCSIKLKEPALRCRSNFHFTNIVEVNCEYKHT